MALPEGLRTVDRGPITLTDRRVVFHGAKHTREWSFAKLMGLRHESGMPITLLQVTNRQKVSGVLYPATATPAWRIGLALALAVFRGDRQALVSALERDRQVMLAQRPAPPPAAVPEQAPISLVVAHAVGTLYLGRPGQGAARRVGQGVLAGVLSLFALSVVAGLASGTTGTTEGAPISAAPSATGTAASPSPTLPATETSLPSPTLARPTVTVPTQRTRTTRASRPTPRAKTTSTATKPPVRPPQPSVRHKPTRTHVSLCGAPTNPWGFTFCTGSVIYTPPADVCLYLNCIPYFDDGQGYVVQCADGMFSKSGGRQGACSHHGGERRPLLK